MQWFLANWFWIVIGIAFVGMHAFGHGGHAGHGGNDGPHAGHGGHGERDNEELR